MSSFLKKKEIIVAITFITGVIVFANYFTPIVSGPTGTILSWVTILAAFSAMLGTLTTVLLNYRKITRRTSEWPFAVVILITLFITIGIGLGLGTSSGAYQYISIQLLAPLFAAVYSIVLIYTLSGAYRGFIVRDIESAVMVITVIIIFLQNAPIGSYFFPPLMGIANWIYDVPSLAALRALRFVMAVGGIFMGIRILIGRAGAGGGEGGDV